MIASYGPGHDPRLEAVVRGQVLIKRKPCCCPRTSIGRLAEAPRAHPLTELNLHSGFDGRECRFRENAGPPLQSVTLTRVVPAVLLMLGLLGPDRL